MRRFPASPGAQKLVLTFLTVFLLQISPAQAAKEPGALPPAYDFAIEMDGRDVGRHTIAFEEIGDELHVHINIDIEVSFGPITFFRYAHENHEIWKDGRLISLETKTDDDGTLYEVSAKASEEGLAVEGPSGSFTAPAGILPTSYWRPETTEKTQLLDTQRGRLIEVKSAKAGEEVLQLPQGAKSAERYTVTGDLKLDLWYGEEGTLLNIAFNAKGRSIAYAVNALDYPKMQKVARNAEGGPL
ncbi:conserved protein [Tepidicaulis marinus]|uniref:Conserved protein n=1 Tax=Tepidicaulis marinus TaxID=1333998 RepID=A0A081BEP3_9HYPH|nr:DUF6134 family protein [Tepidicaulis marinus]GAK46511.1 conserved protein [Tepidicaulis marinus]